MEKKTSAFIDSALVHSAVAALIVGRSQHNNAWDRRSLLDATYLLMNAAVSMVPGPGRYEGASGFYEKVVSAFPEIEAQKFSREKAGRNTKSWLSRYPDKLERAWKALQQDPEFNDWCSTQKEMFWTAHVRMHGALFNIEYGSTISRILGCSEGELRGVYQLSKNVQVVERWSKQGENAEDNILATGSWLLSALIRGKYHEYIAQDGELQLIAHPFRTGIAKVLRGSLLQPVFTSEECLTKVIVGASLLEKSPDRRVAAWVENMTKTRMALRVGKVALPNALTQRDAESAAISAVQAIGINSSPRYVHRALDVGISIGLGTLVSISVSPWAGLAATGLSPLILQLYRHTRDRSAGEDTAKLLFSSKGRFRRLIRSVPGRIEREIRAE